MSEVTLYGASVDLADHKGMLSLQSFLRKGVSLGYGGRIKT